VARPKEFDREEALRRAIPAFWEKGFAGTSTDDLVGAMASVARASTTPSATSDASSSPRCAPITPTASPPSRASCGRPHALAAIERILVDLAEVREKARALGCMGVNAICEMARVDDEVRALTETSAALLEASLTDAIEDGKAKATSPTPSTAALPRASSQRRSAG